MVTCPNQDCSWDLSGEMVLRRQGVENAAGLHPIRCSHCGHCGFIAGQGLHLVFRAAQEYCFTWGTRPAYLTMSITARAMAAYRWTGLNKDILARSAAEWLLVLGHMSGSFELCPDQRLFRGFVRYLEDRMPTLRPHVA